MLDLIEKLVKTKKLWFFDYIGELHEGFLDEITYKPYEGWSVKMHYVPKTTSAVYTARMWSYSLEEYGKQFALTKEEL